MVLCDWAGLPTDSLGQKNECRHGGVLRCRANPREQSPFHLEIRINPQTPTEAAHAGTRMNPKEQARYMSHCIVSEKLDE
jgi:hypothetical protein